jgi:hypothetical protein
VVVKTDSAGNQSWMKVFGGPYYDSQGMICSTLDGNMVLGYCYCDLMDGDNTYRRINLIKLDNTGNVLWDKKYGAIEPENTLLNIRENPDGSLIFTGAVVKEFETDYKYMGWIMKTTADGDSLWYRQYDICQGEGSWHFLYDVVETPDKGYFACGYVFPMPPDTGSQDGWVIKVDSLGCTAPGECWVGQEELQDKTFTPEKPFVIYPNPATEKVTIEFHINPEGAEYELYDFTGRSVLRGSIEPEKELYKLNTGKLGPGLYILKILIPGKKPVMEKVVVD